MGILGNAFKSTPEKQWNRNSNLAALVKQIDASRLFSVEKKQDDSSSGVQISFGSSTILLTTDREGNYKADCNAAPEKKSLIYDKSISTQNGAVNLLNGWLANVGEAFDRDLIGEIAKKNVAAKAPAPMRRTSEP